MTAVLGVKDWGGFRQLQNGIADDANSSHVRSVLEAAHIVPFAQKGPNRVDNGLLLRSDLHRLFDRGLVTIEPDRLTFQVSERIRHDYDNGRVYYELADRPLLVLPERANERPNRAFLQHHRSAIFRP